MTRFDKMLRDMRNNPRDWRIEELETLALSRGFEKRNPRGNHVVFSHPWLKDTLSIPAHRPVKQHYVRRLVELIDMLGEHHE